MAVAKWSGVLSTTEPRNDVGIIKVRQGNINSEIAEFQIVQNNKPYDLTGLTVYFCASFGLNLVEKPAVVVNTTGGKIQYTFDGDSMQSVGRQKGYFSIKKAESKIDSTQEFEFQVESSLMTRSIDGKSYIYKLSTLIKVLDDFIKNGQNNFNTWFDSVKEILYGVDPGGNILRELIEARKNSSGNIFASLKARLDKNEDDTAAQLAQTDDDYHKMRGLGTFFDKLNRGVPATLICFGDSTTGGENVTQNFVDRLRTYIQTTLGYGLLATIVNAGVGGDTTEKGFNRLAESVLNKNPDGVIVNFGINDVGQGVSTDTSMKFYRYIIEHIIAFCDSDIIIRTNNISRNVNDVNVYDGYNRAVEKVANEYKVVFADYYNFMKKQNYTQEDLLLYFLDGVHPNDLGYELMFSFMKQFIVPSTLKKPQNNVSAIELINKKNVTADLDVSQSAKFGWSNYFGHNATKKVVIRFYGNGLKWSFTRSNSAGKVRITSDGTIIENELDLYQSTVVWNSIYEISYNENKLHEVVIDFLGIKNELSINSNVLMGGFIASFDNAGFYAFNVDDQISSQHISGKNIIRDSVTGVLLQSGYASCDKGGSVILPIPYKSAYNVICTQSGNGGGVGNTHEPIYFSSSGDYALTEFYPRWDSQDTKKGINWIAFGV